MLTRYCTQVSPLTCGAALLGGLDLRGRRGARDVDDEQRRARVLGQARRAAGRLRLDHLRPRERVVDGGGVARGQRARDEHVDDVAVLGVDHDERAEVAGALHRRRELVVADHELALVGHEELEARHARVDHRAHVLDRRGVGVRDRHVEAVVDVRRAVRAALPLLERGGEAVGLALDREVDDARDAAGRRGARAGVVVVGGPHAHERHGHVGVVVDQPGEQEAPRRVDDRGALRRLDGPHRGDALAVDEDVGVVLAVGRDDAAALDQRVVRHAVRLPCRTSSASVRTSLIFARHLVDHGRVADERRGDVQDGVAAVVRPGDEPRLEQPAGQEAAQHPLALVGVQARVVVVLHELDGPEEALAADVADDRQRAQLVHARLEVRLVRADVLEDPVALEDLEVAQRDRGAERVPGERDPVHERALLVVVERRGDAVAHHHRAHGGVGGGEALRGRREVRRRRRSARRRATPRGARSRR